MKKHPIHQTAEEKLAQTSQGSLSAVGETNQKLDENTRAVRDLHTTSKDKSIEALGFIAVTKNVQETNKSINELKDYIDHPEVVVRKLEEIKSSSLISNKLLKDISQKKMPEPKEFPKEVEVSLKGIKIMTLRGEDGKTPKKGVDYYTPEEVEKIKKEITPRKNEDYFDGEKGKTPVKGRDYFTKEEISKFKQEITPVKGKDYRDGTDGKTPKKGVDYDDGEDGSPDEPDEVVGKVNLSSKKIDAERVMGLVEVIRQVDKIGSNPMGKEAGGGGNVIRFLSNGVVVSAYVTELNFSTNITPVYDGNGRITLTASGSGGTTYSETPSGVINGSNKAYTTLHTITTVLNLFINGQFIHPAEYVASGAGFTMVTALDSSLSGTGFTIVYT